MWLQRVAWIGQFALVVLAIFGYFFTVRPIYQKQILDEEVARQRVALEQIQRESNRIRAANARISEDLRVKYAFILTWVGSGVGRYAEQCATKISFSDDTADIVDRCVLPASEATYSPGVVKVDDSRRFKDVLAGSLPALRSELQMARLAAKAAASAIRAEVNGGGIRDSEARARLAAIEVKYRASVASSIEATLMAATKHWIATVVPGT